MSGYPGQPGQPYAAQPPGVGPRPPGPGQYGAPAPGPPGSPGMGAPRPFGGPPGMPAPMGAPPPPGVNGIAPGMGPRPPGPPGMMGMANGPPSYGAPRPGGPMAAPPRPMGPPGGMAPGPPRPMGPPPGPMGPPSGHMGPPGGAMGPPSGHMGPPGGPQGPYGAPQQQQQQQMQQQQQPRPPAGFMPPGGPPPPPGGMGSMGGPPGGVPPGGMMAGPGMAGPGMPRPMGPPGMGPPPPPGGGMQPPPGGMGPPPGPPGMPPPPGYGAPPGMDSYGGQRLVEQFESLTLAAGPGSVEVADVSRFPRPVGPERAAALAPQPPYDPGNCSPDNMRPTVNAIPNTQALRARWHLPLGVVVRPMADEAHGRTVPVIPLGSQGIVRCRRCRTYMNPFMSWTDGGRRFKCNVCAMLNEAPVEYFSTLDAQGRRHDADQRPELSCGTVEWVAPTEYMVRPPMPPVYFFAIDVSAGAVASGMVAVVAAAIKGVLDQLPGDERTLVGFLTFDSSLHFYNLKPSLSAPQMMVVGELEEPFLPLPEDLLVNLKDARPLVEALLDGLPGNWAGTGVHESATGPALQAAYLVMNHVGGKLLLFQCGVPSLGLGRTASGRDNPSLYGSEREAQLRLPEDPFFKRFAAEASKVQVSLDVFVGCGLHLDLASWAAIPRYTCGQVYHYPNFHAARDGAKLAAEVTHNLSRPTAWEAVMRIRCSRGLKVSSFHGHFFNRSTDLLALPTCDPDKAFAVQIQHEETVTEGLTAFVQCALLYTSSNGERRIRVHTMMLPIASELSELYAATDAGATAALLAKLGVEKALGARLEETRAAVQSKLAASLKEYRLLHGAHMRNPGALLYPTSMRYLPALLLGLLKTTAFRGGREVPGDERMAALHSLMEAPVPDTLRLAYPEVYDVTDAAGPWGKTQEGQVVLPPCVPASLVFMSEAGVYLLDNGRALVLWAGRGADPGLLVQFLGRGVLDPTVDISSLPLEPPQEASSLSTRLAAVLGALRAGRGGYAPAYAVRQGTPAEAHVVPLFVEDRTQGQMAYLDWLHSLHKAVVNK